MRWAAVEGFLDPFSDEDFDLACLAGRAGSPMLGSKE
jgi:hypothetical protein